MLDQFKEYYRKAKMNQERTFEGAHWTKEDIDDDLIWHVPIYDTVNRRYASFSSLLEAVRLKDKDPKGNGVFFSKEPISSDVDFIILCYLFRLCGSGINYVPREKGQSPFGTHGFGNFWIVDELRKGNDSASGWLRTLPDKRFCDVKGYLLPMIKGGLAGFIRERSIDLVMHMLDYTDVVGKVGIKDFVDEGNRWLMSRGFMRQNFVLTAFAMDMAEYFPDVVDRDSDTYVGSNAKKCLKLILPTMSNDKALRYLCESTGGHSKPYDMEDVACDFIRYLDNFQSKEHIESNFGIKYYNNVHK